jgi:NDP-sugar pyrophosphorylase family protein
MDTLTIAILAAGLSSRYGAAKFLVPVGPDGETLLDYAVYDALASGFGSVGLVVRRVTEEDIRRRFHARFGRGVPVSYVRQELWPLPGGHRSPSARMKPWGTGHAALRLAELAPGPFAVANGDDFYGRTSYTRLAESLTASPEAAVFHLIGFRLDTTLSEHGGVSRAVCELDQAGRLVGLEELLGIEAGEEPGALIGRTVNGKRRIVQPDALVSMGLWGFTPAVFPLLETRFQQFLEQHGEDPEREFLLSDAVGDMVRAGDAEVYVHPAEEAWYGMTYREDRDRVSAHIADLVKQGVYPRSLRRAMRPADLPAEGPAEGEISEYPPE